MQNNVHVLFVIHFPRQFSETKKHGSSFVGFQGGHWISAHLDDICAPTETAFTLNEALNAPISDLFYNEEFMFNEEPVIMTETATRRLERNYEDLEIEDLESINEQTLNVISEQEIELCTVPQMKTSTVPVSDKGLEGDLDQNITREVDIDLEITNSQKQLDKYLPSYDEELMEHYKVNNIISLP